MLVSIHGRFEGRQARQVCSSATGCALAPTGYRWGTRVPQFPQAALAGQGTRSLLFPYAQISAIARQGLPALAAPHGRACWCTSASAAATRTRICFPPWPFPLLRAQGRWQHMALPQCQPGAQRRGLCVAAGQSPSPETSTEQREEESLHGAEGRSAQFTPSHKAVAAGLAMPSQLRSILVCGSSS